MAVRAASSVTDKLICLAGRDMARQKWENPQH